MKNEVQGALNMHFRFKQNLPGYVVISVFVVIIISAMWNFSVDYSEEKSLRLGTLYYTAKWLSENLKDDQVAIIPNSQVLWSHDTSLINRTQSFKEVWQLSGIILQANTTETEKEEARNHLREYVKNNPKVKYLVIDWADKYGTAYFSPRNCEKFEQNWVEAERFVHQFTNRHGEPWTAGTKICEIR